MPNAVWTGTLSFGLVSVSVRLYPATEPKDVRFHLYDESGRRVRYQRVVADEAPPGGGEVPDVQADESTSAPVPAAAGPSERAVEWEEVLRGRETDAGEVVLLSRDEIERVRPKRSRTIDIEDFVELSDIDPVFFEKTYYAVPRSVEEAKPYVLLHRAMQRAGRVGIGRFVLRTKPHLVAVRPMDEVLAVETLFFGDEVRDARALSPALEGIAVDERELDLARQLIEMLKTDWNPHAYADTYREELLRLLAEKESVTAPTEAARAPTASHLQELMAALRESVETAKRKEPMRTRKRAG